MFEFFHANEFVMFFWLLVGHFIADYPLQGDFLSQAKNPDTAVGKLFWKHALTAHSMIHAGFVALITGSVILGLLEAAIHAVTDYAKCKKKITLNYDQAIHLVCKVSWVSIAFALNI